MNDSKHYAWAVQKGLVETWKDSGQIYIRTTLAEGENVIPCELTKADALEIATLLYHLAQGTEGY
ncbi:MAG: hypothetical protein V4732_23075 [Pseudomonadota bacterium]